MEQLNNNRSMSLEERTRLFAKNEETIARSNRVSAETNSSIKFKSDKVEVRKELNNNFEELKSNQLEEALSNIAQSIFGNSQTALVAQGNLSAESVLALLEE